MLRHRQKYDFEWFNNIKTLLFPKNCAACGNGLARREDMICVKCLYKLPRTNFHRIQYNPVFQKFEGRMPVKSAFSFLFFHKGNLSQILLHHLKYKGRQDFGERLGTLFGKDLHDEKFEAPDILIPLPLHPARLAFRGYNQCDSIARGMQKYLNIEIGFEVVKRVVANPSQTRKTRYDRWLNVEHIFKVVEPKAIYDRHVLLIDDVITTGSTLEACGTSLLRAGAREITIATLATA